MQDDGTVFVPDLNVGVQFDISVGNDRSDTKPFCWRFKKKVLKRSTQASELDAQLWNGQAMRHIVRGTTTTSHVSPIGPNSQVRRQFKLAIGTSQRFIRTLKSVTQPGTVCALVVQEQCPLCLGHTQVPCRTCHGQGRLTKAGYHANNPVFVARIVGATKLMYLPDQNILCVYQLSQ